MSAAVSSSPPARAGLKELFAELPPWAHAVAVIVLIALGAMGNRACRHDPPTPAPAPAPAPVILLPQPAPQPVGFQATAETRQRITVGQRLVSESWRGRVADRLERDGFALAGGDGTPLPPDKAKRLANRLSDEQVFAAGQSAGLWGDVGDEGGGLLDFLRRCVQWVKDHPEQVEAILRLLLTLLMFI